MKKLFFATLTALFAFAANASAQTNNINIASTSACGPLYVTLYAVEPGNCRTIASLPLQTSYNKSARYRMTDRTIWPGGNPPTANATIAYATVSFCTGVPYTGIGSPTTGCPLFDFLTVGANACFPAIRTTDCFEDSGRTGCTSCGMGDIINADFIAGGTTVDINIY